MSILFQIKYSSRFHYSELKQTLPTKDVLHDDESANKNYSCLVFQSSCCTLVKCKKKNFIMSKTFERQWKSNATLLTSQGRVQKRESRKKFQHTQEWKATSKDGILKPARSRECSLGASRGKYRQQALKRTNWKIKVIKKLPCHNWSCISKLVEKCKD